MENYIKPDLLKWESGKVNGFSGKNLIELNNGGLKMVKVDALAVYPKHQHPDKTEFVYVLDGNPIITIDQNIHEGKSGDFFILPKAIKHSIANPLNTECLLLVGAIMN